MNEDKHMKSTGHMKPVGHMKPLGHMQSTGHMRDVGAGLHNSVQLGQMVEVLVAREMARLRPRGGQQISVQNGAVDFRKEPVLQGSTFRLKPVHIPQQQLNDFTLSNASEESCWVSYGTLLGQAPDGFNPQENPIFTVACADGDVVFCKAFRCRPCK